MQGIGHLLASSLLVASLLSVLAQNKDDAQPSQLSKRSADNMDGDSATWGVAAPEDDVSVAQKRFNEFVGKRANVDDKRYEFVGKRVPYEFVGKRPYEFLGKRTPYEFVGKRSYEFLGKRVPYEFVGKRVPYEFVGKRPSKRAMVDFYGKRVQLPYEFVGKRIFGGSWERLSTNTVEKDALVKDVSDLLQTRTAPHPPSSAAGTSDSSSSNGSNGSSKTKRYSEWLGKRSAAISDDLLRQLVNKRISEMMRQRLHSRPNPEFVGRREENEQQGFAAQPGTFGLKKRYNEFVGK